MPPSLALLIYFVLFLVFLRWSKDSRESPALWIPVIWLFLSSSRLPSQWLGLTRGPLETAYEEGNSLDRFVYVALIVLALWTLNRRQID